MKTKTEVLLKRMTLMYENIYNLLSAFQEATNAKNDITVELKKEDGTVKTVTVNSFQHLQQELTRIDNNFKSLILGTGYSIDKTGQISQYQKVTFSNAEYLENFSLDTENCIVDNNTIIEDLVFPTIKLPITIDNDILETKIYCKIYDIIDGFDNIPDNPKELTLQYLTNNGKLKYNEYYRTLNVEKQKVQYFGRFNVETVEVDSENSNVFIVTLNTTKYTNKNILGDTIDLKIGDNLTSDNDNNLFEISDIDLFSRTVKLTRIGGIEAPKVGINSLYFKETINTDIKIINFPVKPAKKLIVFFSTENINTISYPSFGIKIDTTNYRVIHNNTTYTIDEYFQKYVTNFTEYINSLMMETTIPYSLGIKPDKPVLQSQNFKVVQINKHIIDAKTQSEMIDLNKKKQQIQNDIDYKQTIIDQTQNEVDTLKFNSIEEKNYRLNKIVQLRNEINTLKQNLLTVTRDIDSNATKYGLKNSKPKYKVIGFWDMQESLYSPLTQAQHIIKYEVQYRYLSKDVDTTDSTTYKMVSNGKEITVAFSNWNELQTRTLNKVKDINGNLKWEEPLLDSVDDININQCSITINEGESIEIKVRAVTEAGYPVAPMKSEWSESLRIDFPDDLKNNNLQATVSQNNIDLNKAEFNAILQNLGLLTHISGTIKESEKTFYHSATDIASGQYTQEQKNIPLDVCIKNILNDINILKQTDVTQNINISFVDFDGESYTITNNTTLEINGGNYSEVFNVLDDKTWGGIVRKRGYIKIRNNNHVPIELRTLVPGVNFDSSNAENYYNVPVIIADNVTQLSKQILYFRNVDLIGQVSGSDNTFKLVIPKASTDKTYPDDSLIDSGAIDENKKLIMLKDDTVSIYKLIDDYNQTNFLGFTTEHPKYNYDNKQLMIEEMKRLAKFNPNLKAEQYQSEVSKSGDENFVGFKDNDIYAFGRYSCGAWLYPYISKPNVIQVIGNTSVSTLIINKESEILIPIIFEYRMVDRLGHINGEINYDIVNGLTYSKKLGVDILINNNIFKFDIKVTAKYKSKITSIDTKNVSSIIGNYNNEEKENLI